MIYTDATKAAMKLCYEAHRGQADKSGMPYVFQAEQMGRETAVVVALLRDVVEDTNITWENLRSMGFCEEVLAALALLTHSKDCRTWNTSPQSPGIR